MSSFRTPAISFVLVETTHSGNIGAAARAMKTMGFDQLSLVNPRKYLTEEALARASGADGIVREARVHTSLEDALADCSLVLGTSARSRTLEWSCVAVDEAALQACLHSESEHARNGESEVAVPRVAIVFGRERSGLTNEELALCHHRLWIPTDPEFSSLNLGAAVQVVAYELRRTARKLAQSHVVNREGDPQIDSHAGDTLLSIGRSSTLDGGARTAASTAIAGTGEQRAIASDPVFASIADELPATPEADDSREAPATHAELEGLFEHLQRVMIASGFLNPDNPRLLLPRLRRLFMRARPLRSELQILRGFLTSLDRPKRPRPKN